MGKYHLYLDDNDFVVMENSLRARGVHGKIFEADELSGNWVSLGYDWFKDAHDIFSDRFKINVDCRICVVEFRIPMAFCLKSGITGIYIVCITSSAIQYITDHAALAVISETIQKEFEFPRFDLCISEKEDSIDIEEILSKIPVEDEMHYYGAPLAWAIGVAIMGHELGHIGHGHLDFLTDWMKNPSVFPPCQGWHPSKIRKTLEFDADATAVHTILTYVCGPFPKMPGILGWVQGRGNPYKFSVFAAFYAIKIFDSFSLTDGTVGTHSSFLHRSMWVRQTAYELIKREGRFSEEEIVKKFIIVAFPTIKFLLQIRGVSIIDEKLFIDTELADFFGPPSFQVNGAWELPGDREGQEMLARWAIIKPYLDMRKHIVSKLAPAQSMQWRQEWDQ